MKRFTVTDVKMVVAVMKEMVLCLECLAFKAGLPAPDVDLLLVPISEIVKLVVHEADCLGCHDRKWLFGFRRDVPGAGAAG